MFHDSFRVKRVERPAFFTAARNEEFRSRILGKLLKWRRERGSNPGSRDFQSTARAISGLPRGLKLL
jgi:hypothetical protein